MKSKALALAGFLISLGLITVDPLIYAQKDTPAPVPVDAMTEKQKKHSKLYDAYNGNGNLRQNATTSTEDFEVTIGPPLSGGDPDSPRFNFDKFLKEMACSSDAIVIGEIRTKSSHLTENESFIFTDYEFDVETVLKGNVLASIQPREVITITRPGGQVQFSNGRKAVAKDSSFKPLETRKRYLLFLRFIPETGAYQAINSKAGFQLSDKGYVKLTDEALPDELESKDDASSFIAQIHTAVANPCGNAKK